MNLYLNNLYLLDHYIRYGCQKYANWFPEKQYYTEVARPEFSDPIKRYDCYPNSLEYKILSYLNHNTQLSKIITDLFEEIEFNTKGKIQDKTRTKLDVDKLVDISLNAAHCRMYALISLVIKHCLKEAKLDFVGKPESIEDLTHETLFQDDILFWIIPNSNANSIQEVKSINKSSLFLNYYFPLTRMEGELKLVFGNKAAKVFEILEDYFICITGARFSNFKCPLDKVWSRNIAFERDLTNSHVGKRSALIQDYLLNVAKEVNLFLKKGDQELYFPWFYSEKYGLVPHGVYVDAKIVKHRPLGEGSSFTLPNIDDYYEALNSITDHP